MFISLQKSKTALSRSLSQQAGQEIGSIEDVAGPSNALAAPNRTSRSRPHQMSVVAEDSSFHTFDNSAIDVPMETLHPQELIQAQSSMLHIGSSFSPRVTPSGEISILSVGEMSQAVLSSPEPSYAKNLTCSAILEEANEQNDDAHKSERRGIAADSQRSSRTSRSSRSSKTDHSAAQSGRPISASKSKLSQASKASRAPSFAGRSEGREPIDENYPGALEDVREIGMTSILVDDKNKDAPHASMLPSERQSPTSIQAGVSSSRLHKNLRPTNRAELVSITGPAPHNLHELSSYLRLKRSTTEIVSSMPVDAHEQSGPAGPAPPTLLRRGSSVRASDGGGERTSIAGRGDPGRAMQHNSNRRGALETASGSARFSRTSQVRMIS